MAPKGLDLTLDSFERFEDGADSLSILSIRVNASFDDLV